jgi:xylulokinase
MSILLGIDVGTSSAKAMLADDTGRVIGTAKENYEPSIPQLGYAEQDPLVWWDAVVQGLRILKTSHPKEYAETAAIGLSGQMHGIVFLDINGNPLRPAIIWLDQRSEKQALMIKNKLQSVHSETLIQNSIYSGFAFPSLLWVQEHEPDTFGKIGKFLFPKDFIRLKLTGILASEKTDASASLLFDVEKRTWARDIIPLFSLKESFFPEVRESTDIAGYVTDQCAEETGLRPNTPVVYGCGDHMAQSIGNGVISEGWLTSNIGSGGQVSAYMERNRYDPRFRLHTFCHAVNQAYTIFGATLCAGMSVNWLKNKILRIDNYDTITKMAGEIKPGSEGLVYLPYLSGERTPHMNPHAKGMFYGLALGHDNRHMVRAVMEGVVFSLKDSLCLLEELGITGGRIIASGGGALDDVWLQIQADILEKEVYTNQVGEQACLGACILAGIGAGIFKNGADACNHMVALKDKIYRPDKEAGEIYRKNYDIYKRLYRNNNELMTNEATLK